MLSEKFFILLCDHILIFDDVIKLVIFLLDFYENDNF